MANKLKNMRLTSVDLVRNGANQEADICLFKSAEPEADPTQPTAEEKNIFKRFIKWLTETPEDDEDTVEKDYNTFDSLTAARENNEKLWQYTNALSESIRSIQMDQDLDMDQKHKLMTQSLEQFDAAMEDLIEALCEASVYMTKSEDEDMGYIFEDLEKSDPEEEELDDEKDPEEDVDESSDIDEIEVVEKFNPNHDAQGRFASAGAGGAGGSDDFLLDDDDGPMPWESNGRAASGDAGETKKPKATPAKESPKNPIPNVEIDTSSYSWFKHGKEPDGVGYYSYEVTHGKNKLSTYNFHGDYHEGLKRVAEKFENVTHISVGV